MTTATTLTVDAHVSGDPIDHYWNNCVGAGRAAEGLRTDWQDQLRRTVRDCGFRYLRFHGLLCDEMGVYSTVNGQEQYHFTYIDMVYDAMLGAGVKPFVEFAFTPEALSSGPGTQFWWKANVTPPKDADAWARLCAACVRHWIERYGLDEVRGWYFEIWNEPDLHAFWNGTKTQYFALYRAAATAIKAVDASLRVGGPATSNFVPDARFDGEVEDFSKHLTNKVEDLDSLDWHGVWIKDFLDYCQANDLPVDFVSTHPYPTDFALDGQDVPEASEADRGGKPMRGRSRQADSVHDDLAWLRSTLAASGYPDAEIHLTEWSSSPTSRDYSHDYLPAATYVAKTILDNIGLADSLSYWVFTDIFEEVGPGPEAFHGGFGLTTMHGIPKATYHTYEFLNRLGDTRLAQTDNGIVTRNGAGQVQAMFYNYPDAMPQAVPIAEYPDHERAESIQTMGESAAVTLTLTGLAPYTRATVRTMDRDHGVAANLWARLGYPRNLTRAQVAMLKARSADFAVTTGQADANGMLTMTIDLPAWAVALLETE